MTGIMFAADKGHSPPSRHAVPWRKIKPNDMKTIVVPVDFSASSANAARYAADMAKAIHANLHLIHVVQLPISVAEMAMTESLYAEMQEIAAQGLKDLWEELVKRTDGKLHIFTHLEEGALEYRLIEFCNLNPPFLVIMGNSGPSLERVMTGSNVARVIHRLRYPLIVVPVDAVFHPIKKIVLACDLEDLAAGMPVPPSFLKELRDSFGSSFEVINICTATQDHQNEAEAAFEFNSWKARLHEIYPEVHFLRTKKVEKGIDEYLQSHPADLLLVFPKKHGLLEFHSSHSKKIALHSRVPVMSIHGE
jgi:nucleotide-binding universal stress UspA family protein